MPAGEVGACGADWTFRALGLGPLAKLLAVTFEQQVSPRAGVKLLWYFRRNGLLRLTIRDAIVLTFQAVLDSHQHVRAIGGNGSNGCNACEKQNAIGAGIGDAGKSLEDLPRLS